MPCIVDNIEIGGPHAELYEAFVMRRRSEGQVVHSNKVYMLRSIAEAMELHRPEGDDSVLPREAVLKWIEPREGESPGTRANRVSCIRGLAAFLRDEGHEAYVIPERILPRAETQVQVYVFNHEEIADVLAVLDNLPFDKRCPLRGLVFPTLFRVLYGCGLRISEALGLLACDVDLDAGVLRIRKTKEHKNRFVPMSASLTAEVAAYFKAAGLRPKSSDVVFPSSRKKGSPYNSKHARIVLQSAFEQAGISAADGTPPRAHDVRHTHACHALDAAAERGEDPHALVPILSAYLGHENVEETMRYLHLTQDSRRRIARTMERLNDAMFPEVCYEED